MSDLIDRDELVKQYDRVHVGPPGGARALMVEAPTVEAIPIEWLNEYVAWLNTLDADIGEQDSRSIRVMLMKWNSEQKTGCNDDYCLI